MNRTSLFTLFWCFGALCVANESSAQSACASGSTCVSTTAAHASSNGNMVYVVNSTAPRAQPAGATIVCAPCDPKDKQKVTCVATTSSAPVVWTTNTTCVAAGVQCPPAAPGAPGAVSVAIAPNAPGMARAGGAPRAPVAAPAPCPPCSAPCPPCSTTSAAPSSVRAEAKIDDRLAPVAAQGDLSAVANDLQSLVREARQGQGSHSNAHAIAWSTSDEQSPDDDNDADDTDDADEMTEITIPGIEIEAIEIPEIEIPAMSIEPMVIEIPDCSFTFDTSSMQDIQDSTRKILEDARAQVEKARVEVQRQMEHARHAHANAQGGDDEAAEQARQAANERFDAARERFDEARQNIEEQAQELRERAADERAAQQDRAEEARERARDEREQVRAQRHDLLAQLEQQRAGRAGVRVATDEERAQVERALNENANALAAREDEFFVGMGSQDPNQVEIRRAQSPRTSKRRASGSSDGLEARIEALERIARERGYDQSNDASLDERVEALERFLRDGDAAPKPATKGAKEKKAKFGVQLAPPMGSAGSGLSGTSPRMYKLEGQGSKSGRYVLGGGTPAPDGLFVPAQPAPGQQQKKWEFFTPKFKVVPDAPRTPATPAPNAKPAPAVIDDDRHAEMDKMMNDLKAQADQLREQMEKMRAELRELPRHQAR